MMGKSVTLTCHGFFESLQHRKPSPPNMRSTHAPPPEKSGYDVPGFPGLIEQLYDRQPLDTILKGLIDRGIIPGILGRIG